MATEISLPAGQTAEAFTKDEKAKSGIAKGIAAKLTGVDHSMIDVRIEVDASRRLLEHRRLSATKFNIFYTITIPASLAATVPASGVVSQINTADKADLASSLTTSLATETSATYGVTVTTLSTPQTAMVPASTTATIGSAIDWFDTRNYGRC